MSHLNFWLKKTDPILSQLDQTPLFRGEQFSFEDLSSNLKSVLDIENLKISATEMKWESLQQIHPERFDQMCISFNPIFGNIYFLMDKEDIKNFTYKILHLKEKKNFSSPILIDGFYRYLILQTLKEIHNTPTFSGLSAKIIENVSIVAKNLFCIDIKIELDDEIFFAKIAIAPDFRRSWNEFFSSKNPIFFDKIKKELELLIQVIGGHTFLTQEEISTIEKGDFIILDRSYIDPKTEGGKVILSLEENPLFLAKIKKNKIHILDFANYHEESEMQENVEENLEEEIPINAKTIEEESSLLKETPIKLTVEIAKISMTLEKLMQLQPGNYLELPISLENPINLTVNGKKIGKGELTMIGETLGVRILEIGK